MSTDKLTFKFVKNELNSQGITITWWPQWREYRVNFKWAKGDPHSAYMTQDLEDAYKTGLEMARRDRET